MHQTLFGIRSGPVAEEFSQRRGPFVPEWLRLGAVEDVTCDDVTCDDVVVCEFGGEIVATPGSRSVPRSSALNQIARVDMQ